MEQHNHVDPSMSRFFIGHISLSTNMKRKLQAFDTTEIRTCKSVRALEAQAGGPDQLEFLRRDCKNYVQKVEHWNWGC